MSALSADQPQETTHSSPLEKPTSRWLRISILLAGIIIGQVVLYGPSLAGRKILLPLDLVAQPNIYTPDTTETEGLKLHDVTVLDLICLMEPARRFAAAEIRAGRFPMWTPYQFAGAPFVFPKYSPFHLVSFLTPSPVILAWSQLLSAMVAGTGAYFFFRRSVSVGFWAAVILAWCYPLTGFFVFWQGFAVHGAVHWLPWVMLAVDRTVRSANSLALPALGVTTCLVLVSGQLDVAGQVMLISGIYGVWRIWNGHAGWFRRKSAQAAVGLAIGWSSGFLLAAPYLLPLLEYAQTGARMVRRSSGAEERPPVGLAALPLVVDPDIYGANSTDSLALFPKGLGNLPESTAAGYVGVLATLVLAPLAWCSRRHRSSNLFWTILGLFGLSWSLDIPGFVDLLRLPGLNMMSHNRLVFATSLALLALAATGLEAIRCGEVSWRRWFWLPSILLLGLSVWFAHRSLHLSPTLTAAAEAAIRERSGGSAPGEGVKSIEDWFVSHYRKAAVLCGIATCAWGFLWRPGYRRFAVTLAGVIMMADLVCFAYGRRLQYDPKWYFPDLPIFQQIKDSPPGRVVGYSCLPAAIPQITGLRDIRGYDSIDPGRLIDLLSQSGQQNSMEVPYAMTQWYVPRTDIVTNTATLRMHPIMNMLNVRYLICRFAPEYEVRPILHTNGYWAVVNTSVLPRVYIPRRVEIEMDDDLRLNKLGSPDFNPSDVAYVESPVALTGECHGQARIVEEIPTRLKILNTMETDGLVVLADLWDKGWHAYLNGKLVPILRANHALRGVVVPAGNSRLEFRYEPRSFIRGLWLASCATLVLVGWSIAVRRRHRHCMN